MVCFVAIATTQSMKTTVATAIGVSATCAPNAQPAAGIAATTTAPGAAPAATTVKIISVTAASSPVPTATTTFVKGALKMKNARTAARQKRIKLNNRLHASQQQASNPTLRFTPYAWAKLVYLRDVGETEIGGFGISAAGDPMLIEDIALVRQQCDWASVVFDDEAVADFFEEQVEAGRQPSEFARLWIHTHPGNCPLPSATDEATLERVFGGSDWAVMFILARDGSYYARLRFNAGTGWCD
jgi:hypothetical protein